MDANTYLGDYVETTHGYRGRVYLVHYSCPESDAWLQGLTFLGANPMRFKRARWVSILVNDGGAVAVPDLSQFVRRVEPFAFTHRDADDFFRPAPMYDCQLEFGEHEHDTEADAEKCQTLIANMIGDTPDPAAAEYEAEQQWLQARRTEL